MKVAYITCIKNEQDLIYFNLKYYYNIGIRDFYIMYNNSNYLTREAVKQFADEHPNAIIQPFEDTEIAYRQPERFKKMSDMAYNNGCDWILPVDADEILKLPKGVSIQSALSAHNAEYGQIKLKWIDYHPTHRDDKEDYNYFTRWKYRQPNPRGPSKIIVKWKPGMSYIDGHHGLAKHRKVIANAEKMFVAHFVNREKTQIKNKRIAIGRAFIDTFGRDSERPQVKEYLEIEKEGDAYFDRIWEALCEKRKKMFPRLVYDPINPALFEN